MNSRRCVARSASKRHPLADKGPEDGAARHGDATDAEQIAQSLAPDARVHAATTSDGIAVTVEVDVSLIGPEGTPLVRVVTGRALVPVSQYRSVP